MSNILKTKIGKEDFKRAYGTCAKTAWIMYSYDNFLEANKLLKEKKYQFDIDANVEDEDDYNSSASVINVFETFKEAFENENDQESLQKWIQAWENEDGFDTELYSGDSIEDGNAVGQAARERYDLLLKTKYGDKFKSYDFSHLNFKDSLERTKEILEEQKRNYKYKYLYEPAFEFDNSHLRTRCDILELCDDNEVIIYEVKGTSKVKKEHFWDLAYQRYVLEQNGFKVKDMFIVHMDSEYIYGSGNDKGLKQIADDMYNSFDVNEWNYQSVVQHIKDNDLLKPFTNDAKDDIDLLKVFVEDKWMWGNAQERPTLMELYETLVSSHPMIDLLNQLANILSIKPGTEAMFSLFNNKYCIDLLEFKKGTKSRNAMFFYPEKYCFHVIKYFDKTKENIFNLTGLHRDVKAMLYKETGFVYFDDIESLDDPKFPTKPSKKKEESGQSYFNHAHSRVFDVYKNFAKSGKVTSEDIIDLNNISWIEKIVNEYRDAKHVYMFDFETVKWALPHFWISKTYQQIPFQYSIDVISDENYDYNHPETMEHHDFIESERIDPRPNFLVKFIEDIIVRHGEGVYVAYNKSFEKSVLKYLAAAFPKYKVPLLYVASHTIDLMDFFKGNKKEGRPDFLIYHPNFHGSYSIKKTQPALDEQFNYHDLTINKGDKAAQVFRMFEENKINDEEWKTVKPNMIKYCNRDTLAMVVILQQVENHLKNLKKEI